jgi:hypothetical protein
VGTVFGAMIALTDNCSLSFVKSFSTASRIHETSVKVLYANQIGDQLGKCILGLHKGGIGTGTGENPQIEYSA